MLVVVGTWSRIYVMCRKLLVFIMCLLQMCVFSKMSWPHNSVFFFPSFLVIVIIPSCRAELRSLVYFLYQRKELCKLHEKLEQEKKILIETIANRKKFLSSLPSHLKSLKKASLPVQNQLGVLHTKKLKQKHLAELLPPPLYVINSQLVAQKEAFGENIDLEIVGSVKDAHTFARQQANKDTGNWM